MTNENKAKDKAKDKAANKADAKTENKGATDNTEAMTALVSVARAVMPLIESYGRSKEAEALCEAGGDRDKVPCGPMPIEPGSQRQLSADERRAYGMAFARLLAEGSEIAANGAGGAQAVTFDPKTGNYPAPSVTHLFAAVSRLRGFAVAPIDEQEAPQMRVLAMTSEPAEYEGSTGGPVPVRMLRRGSYEANQAPVASSVSRSTSSGCGCGCGGSGSCGSCAPSAPIATRNPDGSCSPNPFEVSCETQVRIKECIRTIICDFLRCLDRRLCVGGKIDFSNFGTALIECLGEALCTLLRCVPDALCPPPATKQLCSPRESECLPCNFAVEESP